MDRIREIDEVLGTAAVERRKREFGLSVDEQPDTYKFLDRAFVVGDEPGVRTEARGGDLDAITRWVADARKQADFVVMSLHCHEGPAGEGNKDEPAEFIVNSARAIIDAGADVFVGHGPHMLRGIEIYKGKPIFYSLGNFMFMCENVRRLPAEMYEQYKLPADSTPGDLFDFESKDESGQPKAFHADRRFWETILPVCTFRGGTLTDVEIHPVTLRLEEPRTRRGAPAPADREHGLEILDQIASLSEPFGTEISWDTDREGAVGWIKL